MRIIDQLVYKITGDNTSFDKSIDQSDKRINTFGSTAQKIFAGVTVAAIAASIKKVADLAIESATLLDRVDKMSQKIGLSREAFQEWDYILGQNGASIDGLQLGLKTLSTAADEARQGTAQYTEVFDRLNVSVVDSNGNLKDQETLFNEVFSALADVENGAERTALATRLLGRSATELAPAFNVGSAEIEKLRNQAHQLGLVYEDELIDKGVVLGDNIDALTQAFTAWRTKSLEPVIGIMVSVTDKMLGNETSSKRLKDSTSSLATAMTTYKDIVDKLSDPIGDLTEAERALLEIQRQRSQLQVNQAIIEVGKAYEETQQKLRTLNSDEIRYQRTVDASLAIINKYTPEQREEIRNYQQQGSAVTDMTMKKRELLTAEGNLERAQLNLLDTQNKLQKQNTDFNASIIQIAQAVVNEQVEISTLENINADFAQSVREQVVQLTERTNAIARADAQLEKLKGSTLEAVQANIDYYESTDDGIYKTHILNGLYEMQNELLAEEAKVTADATEKKSKQNEIIDNLNASLAMTDTYEKALGDQYDQNADKVSLLTAGIKALVESGLDPASTTVQGFITQLMALQATQSEYTNYVPEAQKAFDAWVKGASEAINNTNVTPEAQLAFDKWLSDRKAGIIQSFNDQTKAQSDATERLNSFYNSDRDNFIANLEAQSQEFLSAGVSMTDVAKWRADQMKEYDDQIAENAKQKAQEARDAWISYGTQIVSSIGTAWANINTVQENQHEEEMNRLQEANNETLKTLDSSNSAILAKMEEEGATAEELSIKKTKLEKTYNIEKTAIDDAYNEKKKQYAIEDLKRKKAQGTFQAIIDTASAVIGFLANPGGWAGVGLSAGAVATGATQIAAIQSEPLPAFEVGSIRIPQDTQAIVHKGETILPEPIAEQARTEGITIAPNNATKGVPAVLNMYIDGRKFAESVVTYINSGQTGRIDMRVVK